MKPRTTALFAAALALAACSGPEPRPARPTLKATPSRPRPPLEPGPAPDDAGELELHVIDVGQGDALWLRCPDGAHQMLIDAGAPEARYAGSAERFQRYLAARQAPDDPLDVVVASHMHADHLGSMPEVVAAYAIDYYVDNGRTSALELYRRNEAALAEHPPAYYLSVASLEPGVHDVDFCPRPDVSARVLRAPGFGSGEFEDDNSVVVRVDHGDASFLLMGDAEAGAESRLLGYAPTRALLDCDLLKVGGHGSREAATAGFLAAVTPEVAAISCGAPDTALNVYLATPRRVTVERLLEHVRPRPGGPVELTVCDDEDEGDAGLDTIAFVVDRPGEWVGIEVAGAVYTTAERRDLVFVSDGETVRLAEGDD